MTSKRRQLKSLCYKEIASAALMLSLVAFEGLFSQVETAHAQTELIVNNPNTGIAIDGIDPVAYFTDKRVVTGRPQFEYRYARTIWRFQNIGNLVAFSNSPQVYMPRYGGYDSIAIARGIALPGNPLLWTIYKDRLYLFYNEARQEQFMENPEEAEMAADKMWPTVSATLLP